MSTRDYQLNPHASDIVYHERFLNATSVGNNGGTISGVTVNNGGTFTNTDYITYNAPQCMISTTLTMQIEFTPSFAVDDSANHYFMYHALESGDTWSVIKNSANQLRVDWKNTAFALALASYQDYWKANAKNVLVICLTNGSSTMYLNGTLVASSGAGLGATTTTKTFKIGNNLNGFDGVMHNFIVYCRKLTAGEVTDIQNNSTYNYENKAVLNLPMHDKIGSAAPFTTTDLSGFGNNATYGDGAGSNEPTKLKGTNGNSYAGAQYLSVPYDSSFDFEKTDKFSIVQWVNHNNVGATVSFFSKNNNDTSLQGYYILKSASEKISFILSTDVNAGEYAGTTTTTDIPSNTDVILGITYDGSGSGAGVKIYFDGVEQPVSVSPNNIGTSIKSTFPFNIGERNGGLRMTGKIYPTMVFPLELTTTQMRNEHLKGLKYLGNN